MPLNDWPRVKVGDICELINGRGFKPHEWTDIGLPIIRIQNLNGGKQFNFYNGTFDPKILVQPGQLLFAWLGSKGTSFGPHIWSGPKAVLNYHTWKVVPKPDVLSEFLFQALRFITSQIEDRSQGAAGLVHTQKGYVEKMHIALPPLGEQRRIAEILGAWDIAVDRLQRLVAAKQNRCDWLIERLFSESGCWTRKVFGEFLTESQEQGSDGANARKLSVKLYGKGIVEKEERLKGSENTRYFKRKAGQLVYSKLDFLNGAFGIIPGSLDGLESTLDLPAFDISGDVSLSWLLEYLIRPQYYRRQLGLARGQRIARRVNPSDFLKSAVMVPPRLVQDRISEQIQVARTDITSTIAYLELLKRQRMGLTQKLFTAAPRFKSANDDTAFPVASVSEEHLAR